MPLIWRAMEEELGQPRVGSARNQLGVRVPPSDLCDVHPDETGRVNPRGDQGMSVAPGLESLLPHHVPRRLRERIPSARGSNQLRVWRLGAGGFGPASVTDDLRLAPTSRTHGVVEPARSMLLAHYQTALAATRESWSDGEQT